MTLNGAELQRHRRRAVRRGAAARPAGQRHCRSVPARPERAGGSASRRSWIRWRSRWSRLPQPIPGGTPFQARAQLAAQFASGQSLPSLPSDSIALGVVAMQLGLPAWFDPALLRHPLRAADDANAVNDDLGAALCAALCGPDGEPARRRATPNSAPPTSFPLLPARGMLPTRQRSIPLAATQTFFPEQIDVAWCRRAPTRSPSCWRRPKASRRST